MHKFQKRVENDNNNIDDDKKKKIVQPRKCKHEMDEDYE